MATKTGDGLILPEGTNKSRFQAFDDVQPGEIAQQEYVQAMQEHARQLVRVVPTVYTFYRRNHYGRRCSCVGIDDSPASECFVCYGTGVVGGYEKRGCQTEVLDCTRLDYTASNVAPDFSKETSPILFVLRPDRVLGEVVFALRIPNNAKGLDVPPAYHASGSTQLHYRIGVSGEWLPIAQFERDVEANAGSDLFVRARLYRSQDTIADSIWFGYMVLRFRLQRDVFVRVEESLSNEAVTFTELGTMGQVSSKTAIADSDLGEVTTDDFFHNVATGRRWKPTTVKAVQLTGRVIGWEMELRIINPYEVAYTRVL